MVGCAIGRDMTRPCDRAGHSFSVPVTRRSPAGIDPAAGRLCRPRGRLPLMFDTLAIAQQLAAALDRQRAVKGPAAGCCLMPREHEPDE